MKVKCFGIFRDITMQDELIIDRDRKVSSILALKQYLVAQYPEIARIKSYRVAVNQAFAVEGIALNDTDEIALIPPVSGG